MIEMICDKGAEPEDVDAELAKHGFPPMNSRSYDIVKDTYCAIFAKDPQKRKDHIYGDSIPMGDL